jgi:hypothetical protein
MLFSQFFTMAERLLSDNNAESLHVRNYKKFISVFFSAYGAWQILIISTLYAVGIGSVLGLVRFRMFADVRLSPKAFASSAYF